MATQLFFQSTAPDWSRGQGDADQQGTTQNWSPLALATTRGGAAVSATRTSIAGTVTGLTAGTNLEWISGPLNADTTISGTVTFNLWGNQAANANNTGLGCIVQRLDSQGAIISTIVDNPEIGTELPNTTPAVRNETASPTSTNMLKGDRLRIRVYFNDAAGVTMGSGGALVFRYAGTTAAVNGDSYVTFTENFGFLTTAPTEVGTSQTDTSGPGDNIGLNAANNQFLAQSFQLGADLYNAVDIYCGANFGSPTDGLTVDIQSDSSGAPSGTVLATATVTSPTASAANRFTFASPVSLSAGTTYWIVVSRTGALDGINRRTWDSAASNIYASGSPLEYSAGAWTTSGISPNDFAFSVLRSNTLYLTNTAAEVDPNGGSFDAKEAWTSRGAGVQSATTSDVAGPTAPIQATASAGGNALEWFTKQLTAFTLDGLIACNIRALEVNAASNAAVRCEIAVCASDGTSPTIWGASNDGIELGTSEAAMTWSVAGDATAITDGQRLRIRIYFDDGPGVAMGASSDMTLYWAGTSAAASGDTYITLPQTVTEYAPSGDEDVTPATVAGITAVPVLTAAADANLTTVEVTATTTVHGATVSLAVDADVTPTTVVSQASVDVPTVVGDASVTSTTVAALTTVSGGTIAADANTTLATATAQAAVDTPTITANADITPTTIVGQGSVDVPTLIGDANVTTTTVLATVSIATPTVSTEVPDAEVSLTTVIGIASIPVPEVIGNANAPPDAVAAIAAVAIPSITADAAVTPSTVVAVAAISTPIVAADANLSLVDISAIAAVSTPSIVAGADVDVLLSTTTAQAYIVDGWSELVEATTASESGDANISLTTVVAITAIPALTVEANADTAPSSIAAIASVQVPTITADANLTTTTVAAITAVPTPTIAANADVTLTTVAAVASIDTPAISLDANVTLTTVVAQAAIDVPSVSAAGEVNITTSTVAAQATVDTPVVSGDANLTAGNVATSSTVETPSIAGNADVTPVTVAAITAVPSVTIDTTSSADVTPSTVIAQVTIDAPSIQIGGDAALTTATVASNAAIDIPTVSADANLATALVACITVVPGATVTADADVTPSTVSSIAAVPTPTITAIQSPTVTLTTVTAQAAIDSPNISAAGNVDITLATVVGVTTVPGATASVDAEVTTSTIQAVAAVLMPSISTGASVTLVTVLAIAEIPTPNTFIGTAGAPVAGPTYKRVLVGVSSTDSLVSPNGHTAPSRENETEELVGAPRAVMIGAGRNSLE